MMIPIPPRPLRKTSRLKDASSSSSSKMNAIHVIIFQIIWSLLLFFFLFHSSLESPTSFLFSSWPRPGSFCSGLVVAVQIFFLSLLPLWCYYHHMRRCLIHTWLQSRLFSFLLLLLPPSPSRQCVFGSFSLFFLPGNGRKIEQSVKKIWEVRRCGNSWERKRQSLVLSASPLSRLGDYTSCLDWGEIITPPIYQVLVYKYLQFRAHT